MGISMPEFVVKHEVPQGVKEFTAHVGLERSRRCLASNVHVELIKVSGQLGRHVTWVKMLD
jgi:hypothetical protein